MGACLMWACQKVGLPGWQGWGAQARGTCGKQGRALDASSPCLAGTSKQGQQQGGGSSAAPNEEWQEEVEVLQSIYADDLQVGGGWGCQGGWSCQGSWSPCDACMRI